MCSPSLAVIQRATVSRSFCRVRPSAAPTSLSSPVGSSPTDHCLQEEAKGSSKPNNQGTRTALRAGARLRRAPPASPTLWALALARRRHADAFRLSTEGSITLHAGRAWQHHINRRWTGHSCQAVAAKGGEPKPKRAERRRARQGRAWLRSCQQAGLTVSKTARKRHRAAALPELARRIQVPLDWGASFATNSGPSALLRTSLPAPPARQHRAACPASNHTANHPAQASLALGGTLTPTQGTRHCLRPCQRTPAVRRTFLQRAGAVRAAVAEWAAAAAARARRPPPSAHRPLSRTLPDSSLLFVQLTTAARTHTHQPTMDPRSFTEKTTSLLNGAQQLAAE